MLSSQQHLLKPYIMSLDITLVTDSGQCSVFFSHYLACQHFQDRYMWCYYFRPPDMRETWPRMRSLVSLLSLHQLDSEAHSDWSLVTELSVYTTRSCSLLFCWMRSLISECILSAGHSQQHPTNLCLLAIFNSTLHIFLGLLELCQPAYLQYRFLCLTHPRLALYQSASFCVFHGFMEWFVQIFLQHWRMLWPVPLSQFLSGLHQWKI